MTAYSNLGRALDDLDSTVQRYSEEVVAAAEAEAEYKRVRARTVLRAKGDGAGSMSAAENVADADDTVSDLLMRRLTTSAVADASKQRIASLRERIGAHRSYLADQRTADQLHAQSGVRT